jgi:flavoprotein
VVLAVAAAAALPLQVVPADQTWAVMEEMVSLATLIRIFKNCATSVAVAAAAAIATMLEMAVAAVAAQEANEEMKFLLRD